MVYSVIVNSSALTIKDIAKKAGVSVATISRAMNAQTRGQVASKTLELVDAVIKKHDYTLNIAAKHLRQSSTKTIGIVFPYVPGIFYSIYYTHILAGATEYLLETDYRFKMLLLKEGQSWDNYNFRSGEGVDGLIIIHWFKIFSNQAALEKINIPFVLINDYDPKIKTHFVCADQVMGGRLAAEHLYTKGHRQIGILSGPRWSVDSRQRIEGFQSFLADKSIKVSDQGIVDGKYLEQNAYEATTDLLKNNPAITAIFCCNDQMAFGALRKLKEMRKTCPEDISLIGYDDELRAAYSDPPLTTLKVDSAAMAREAAQTLLSYLKVSRDHKSIQGLVSFNPVLIERQSVKNLS